MAERTILKRKIYLCGDSGVGKNTWLNYNSMMPGLFKGYIKRLGIEVNSCRIANDDFDVKLFLWDVTGETKAIKFQEAYRRGAGGALIFANAVDNTSLETLPFWRLEAEALGEDKPIAVVVTHMDLLDRSASDLESQLKTWIGNLPLFKTSTVQPEKYDPFAPLKFLFEEITKRYCHPA